MDIKIKTAIFISTTVSQVLFFSIPHVKSWRELEIWKTERNSFASSFWS